MTDIIAVDSDLLARHAGRVEQVASDIGVAVEAAKSMNVARGAFGLMCSFLVPPVLTVTTLATHALASSQRLVERSSRELRKGVDGFARNEDDVIDVIEGLRKSLDAPRAV